MARAIIIMNHLINVKYILCPPAVTEEASEANAYPAEQGELRNVENDKIRNIVAHTASALSPSLVSRKSCYLPVHGKYPVQSAIQVLKKMEDLGLGSLREVIHPHNNKRSKLFVKTRFDDLHGEARALLLHSLGITKEPIDASFHEITPSCSD